MATERADIVIRVGPQIPGKVFAYAGTDDPNPLVYWQLPAGITQRRYRVAIQHAEPVEVFEVYGDIVEGSATEIPLSTFITMTDSFAGLCKIWVEISEAQNGAMEYVSTPFYFVYDPLYERLYNATGTRIEWGTPPDLDNVPVGQRRYQLQVGSTPLFDTGTIVDNQSIPQPPVSQVISYTMPAWFTPETDRPYFYRVRCWDGLDWGLWSRVNAFVSRDQLAPGFRIDDVVPHENATADYDIYFTISGVEPDYYTVEFSFTGNWVMDPYPCNLADSGLILPPGQHIVTWRTLRQVQLTGLDGTGRVQTDDVIVYAKLINNRGEAVGNASYGPFYLDQKHVHQEIVSGGTSPQTNDFPVCGRIRAEVKENLSLHMFLPPVDGRLAKALFPQYKHWKPVHGGPPIFYRCYGICPIEQREQAKAPADAGGGGGGEYFLPRAAIDETPPAGYTDPWPIVMSKQNVGKDAMTWDDYKLDPLNSEPLVDQSNPHRMKDNFIWLDPTDWTHSSDCYATPVQSRDWSGKYFLKGYYDLNGMANDYPNGYDFNKRPEWHRGREIWGEDDGWVEVIDLRFTDYDKCGICQGKGWLPHNTGGGAPYYRGPCTNPNCRDGFDFTKLLLKDDTNKPTMAWYFHTTWWRLSVFADADWLRPANRHGLWALDSSIRKTDGFIWGVLPSNLDGVGARTLGDGSVTYDYFIVGDQRMDGGSHVQWTFANQGAMNKPATHQLLGADPIVTVWEKPERITGEHGPFTSDLPVRSNMAMGRQQKTDYPADGRLGVNKIQFYMGGEDPEIETDPKFKVPPGHFRQPGSLHIRSYLTRAYEYLPLGIRFWQGLWDAYVTVHVQGQEADDLYLRFQFRAAGEQIWHDVRADNGLWNPVYKAWLVPPHQMHMFWNTINQNQFAENVSYYVRVIQLNPTAHSETAYEHSTPFRISRNAINPVSILSTEYDPWTRYVTVKFRCDDTQGDTYTLFRYWCSWDDGKSWNEISPADIVGNTTDLESTQDGSNIHTVIWRAGPYITQPGYQWRLKIESILTGMIETMQIPNFKWLTPYNPYLDQAEQALGDLLGNWATQRQVNGQWVPVNPPVWVPGELWQYQIEFEQIRRDQTAVAPSGIYSFITFRDQAPDPIPSGWIPDPSGWISDPSGYKTWLKAAYSVAETHGQALGRVSSRIDSIVRVEIPHAQDDIRDVEVSVRKNLIDQGYYAERYFKQGPSGIREVVDAQIVSNQFGQINDTDTVERWWQFRVQNVPVGGDNLVDPSGIYRPSEITTLERVCSKWQMDFTETFDSQIHGRPLRERIFNYDGNRLAVAFMMGSTQASDTVNVGATLKLPPSDLPGQQAGDVLADDQTTWETNYIWRVASYNYFSGPTTMRPRPLITVLRLDQPPYIYVDYLAQAHEQITQMSLEHDHTVINQYYTQDMLDGYDVSHEFLAQPTWVGRAEMNFVSDRRAPSTDLTRAVNRIPWVPAGTDRRQPCVFYDDQKQQYVMFHAKVANDGRWRIMGARAMALHQIGRYTDDETPVACEYDVYFADHSALMISGPCVIKAPSTEGKTQYWMYMTVQPVDGPAYVAVSTSADADSWESPVRIDGVASGSNPGVVYDNGKFHLWYQRTFNGRYCIFYCTSDDGYAFVDENFDQPVLSKAGGVGSPKGLKMGSTFVVYYNDLSSNNICSQVWNPTAEIFESEHVEVSPTQILIGNQMVSVTPCNPFVFYDRYLGNLEAFMAFNFVYDTTDANGQTVQTAKMFLQRLEDRVWIPGAVNMIFGDGGNLVDVPSTRDGVPRTLRILASANGIEVVYGPGGISIEGNVKVRLRMAFYVPTQLEYHRQSPWVHVGNKDELNSWMSPIPWFYNAQLTNWPYMPMGSGG